MKDDYTPRIHETLATGVYVEHPPDMPELVYMHDPAEFVFTDFTRNRPAIITADVSIDAAMSKMKTVGVHLLLVVDDADVVIGQITASDILGDVPVRLAQTTGKAHSEIMVDMIMTPQKDITVVEWSHIKNAKIGHIVATMHALECCHLPVVENGRIRGLFSARSISWHLGHEVSENTMCAHSLAEIVQTLS